MALVTKIIFRSGEIQPDSGIIKDISLIQIGDALGHGIRVDQVSLESAKAVLGDTLPAYLTHSGAYDDRILNEIGVFSGFSVEDGKLKADQFKALKSFQTDEADKFNRLFDIAQEMPSNFGISLVFTASLVWVMNDGSEIPVEDEPAPPPDVVADFPAVRFKQIESADFVDSPAANADGLFTSKTVKIMSENTEIIEETPVPETEEEVALEATEATEQVSEAEEVPEIIATEDSTLDLIASLEERVNGIESAVQTVTASNTELTESVSTILDQFEAVKALSKNGVAPVSHKAEETQKPSIADQFKNAEGAEATRIWRENKSEILSNFNR